MRESDGFHASGLAEGWIGGVFWIESMDAFGSRSPDLTLFSPADCEAAFMETGGYMQWSEVWAEHALRHGWCERWLEGAIFPREMAYFLSEASRARVTHVIECGRQDGFSTRILHEYAASHVVTVDSIDYAVMLPGAWNVYQHSGDAFELLPKLVREISHTARIALLIDGPKGASALALVSALALDRRIVLVAMHNRARGDVPGARFYEQEDFKGAHWETLAGRERRLKARRSLTQSSLAVVDLTPWRRLCLAHTWKRAFHLYQPMLLRLGWRTVGTRWTKQLFLQSFRLWGS